MAQDAETWVLTKQMEQKRKLHREAWGDACRCHLGRQEDKQNGEESQPKRKDILRAVKKLMWARSVGHEEEDDVGKHRMEWMARPLVAQRRAMLEAFAGHVQDRGAGQLHDAKDRMRLQ